MKTILALLLALAGLTLNAAPKYLPLPGTPEGAALAAAARTNPAVVSTPAATSPAAMIPVTPMREAAAPASNIVSIMQPPATSAPEAAAPANIVSTLQPPAAPVPPPRLSPATPPPIVAPATANTNSTRYTTRAPSHRPATPLTSPTSAAAVAPPSIPTATSVSAASPAAAKPAEEMISVAALRFQNMPLEQVLDFYAQLVNRTILRPASLPAATITIKAQTELTKSEALQALDSVLGLNGIVLIPVGEKFIKVVPQAQANQEGAMINTNGADALPDLGTYVTHVVQLRYTKPSEIVTVLAPFAKMGPPQAIDGNGILIIRDYTENVKRMLELIDQIDVAVPSEIVSEVIPIKYALAADIASALNSVGGASTGSVGGTGTTGAGAGVTGRRGLGTGGPQTVGSPMTGNTAGGIPVNRLGGAGAPTFQDRLRSIIQKASAGGGGDFQLIGPNKIIPDERTNSLLVFASRADMEMIKAIINKLDVVLAQVLIESIILDVTLGDDFKLGVSAGQAPLSSGNISGGGAMNNNGSLATGMAFLNNLIPSFATNIIGSVTNITQAFNSSTNINFPSGDGLTYFGKLGPTWNVALSAMAGNNNVKVLARPSIQTSHAVPAQIFVGETRPYITGTYYNGYSGGPSSQYQQSQIGISLNVTPLINPDGLVVMDIQQQVQQVGGSVTIDGNSVPITQDQNASSKVAVRDGETIVMGGFIQNQKSESKSGIPILKDIPLLGALFRTTSTTGARRELLVMIRPTVLKTPDVAALHTQVEMDRHPTIKEANDSFQKEEKRLLKHANRVVKPAAADKNAAAKAEKAVAAADKAAAIAEAKALDAAAKAADAEANADAGVAEPADKSR